MNRMTRLAFVLTVLALEAATGASAFAQQPKKRIEIGGDHGPDPTTDWPRAAVRVDMTDAQRAAALDDLVGRLAEKDLFSGVVLVAKNGSPVLRKAWGLASLEYGAPNRPDTKFNIGSIDKSFTGTAIRLLARDGKLSLDDTIARHLPDYKGEGADRITLRQLLEQRSGMGDIFNSNWSRTPRGALRTLADYVPLFEKEPLEFSPGSSQRYSNAGFVVLGLVVERVSGRTYDDFVKERLFKPLGMADTYRFESDQIVPNRATGYTKRGSQGPLDGVRANVHMLPGKPSSAGGGTSTADDLLKWGEGQRNDRLGLGRSGGLGVAGGSPGVNAVLEVCSGGVTIVVLANLDPPSAEYVGRQARALFGCGED